MKFSLNTRTFYHALGMEEGLKVLAEGGAQCVDLGLHDVFKREPHVFREYSDGDFDAYFANIARVCRENGMEVFQTHAPCFPFSELDEDISDRVAVVKRAIRATAVCGAKYMVLHPIILKGRRYGLLKEENDKINEKFFREIDNFLGKYGIIACVENMYVNDPEIRHKCKTVCSSVEEMRQYSDGLIGSKNFALCIDVGHANLYGDDPLDYFRELAPLIRTVHVHDNDGDGDLHVPRGFGYWKEKIDFAGIYRALLRGGFEGCFNWEVSLNLEGRDECLFFVRAVRAVNDSISKTALSET